MSEKGFHEYLELHGYFGQSGDERLTRAEYDALDAEYRALVARLAGLDRDERARLRALKGALHRDKP